VSAARTRAVRAAATTVARQVVLIGLSLLVATAFLSFSGYEGLPVIRGIADGLTTDVAGTIRWSTPLILAGLATCITFRAEVWNLGVDGQIYLGAAAATAAALHPPALPQLAVLLWVFLCAMVAGSLFALIPALLKVLIGTNEVVSTLLLNFLALYLVEYLVTGPMRDTAAGTNLNASPVIERVAWLPRLAALQPSEANIGFYLALVAAGLLAVVFYRTALGLEIKIVGANRTLAHYAGIRPNAVTVRVMIASGALAGMIGAIEVTAIQHRLLAGFNPGLGFSGIVVSLLANNHPVGVVFSGLFFGALKNGGINMERVTDVPSAVTDIVMAIVIITISARLAMSWLRRRRSAAVPAAGAGS